MKNLLKIPKFFIKKHCWKETVGQDECYVEISEELKPSDLITVRKFLNDIPIEINEEGIIVSKQLKRNARKRSTMHTTLNFPVVGHRFGSWKDSNTVILSPYEEVVRENGKPISLAWQDTFWLGDLKYPKKSVVITADQNVFEKLDKDIYEVIYVPKLKSLEYDKKDIAFKEVINKKIKELGYNVVEHDSLGGAAKEYNSQLRDLSQKSDVNYGIGSKNWTEKLDEYHNIDIEKTPKEAIIAVARIRSNVISGTVFSPYMDRLKKEKEISKDHKTLADEVRDKIIKEIQSAKNSIRERDTMPLHIFRKVAEMMNDGEAEEVLLLGKEGQIEYFDDNKTIMKYPPKFSREERKILEEIVKSQEIFIPEF